MKNIYKKIYDLKMHEEFIVWSWEKEKLDKIKADPDRYMEQFTESA